MKIKYLGTAAVEGVPALFCNCRVCRKSREAGGRNMRSRSQALINDELLLEFNPDTVWHYHKYNFDWEKICACLITHAHSDHLYAEDVENAKPAFTHGHRKIEFYAGKSGYEKLRVQTEATSGGADAHLIEAGKRFAVGGLKTYSVMPMPANHSESTTPLIFSIKCGDKRMLYAHDTGWFPEETWKLLEKEGRFDLLSLDCTGCVSPDRDWVNGHMSMGTINKVLDRMREGGLIDGGTKIVVNHFSHNGGLTYDEMVEAVKKYGIIVSYDGLEIEF